MRYFYIILITVIAVLSLSVEKAYAATKIAGSSAVLHSASNATKEDNRATVLEAYLKKQNSPLAAYAKTFVAEADKNDIDWKLVASIAGLESSFGKRIPANSFNAWGWGVYGDKVMRFASWEDAITTISAGIRTNYMDKWGADDVYEIGKIYASSPTWAQRVTYFMSQVEKFEAQYNNKSLSISI